MDHLHGEIISTRGQLTPQVPQVKETDSSVATRWEWRQTPPIFILNQFLPEPMAEARHFVDYAQWERASQAAKRAAKTKPSVASTATFRFASSSAIGSIPSSVPGRFRSPTGATRAGSRTQTYRAKTNRHPSANNTRCARWSPQVGLGIIRSNGGWHQDGWHRGAWPDRGKTNDDGRVSGVPQLPGPLRRDMMCRNVREAAFASRLGSAAEES